VRHLQVNGNPENSAMGFDICWWRYSRNAVQDHFGTSFRLREGSDTSELEPLPIDHIRQRIAEVLDGTWERVGADCWQNGSGVFQFRMNETFIDLTGYGDLGDDLGAIAAIMDEFHCPAFDPQFGSRHGTDHSN
jgi:hypothetical protein